MHALVIFESFSHNVQMIKRENGLSKGFAFVTMASPKEAQAAVEKFNSSVSINVDRRQLYFSD